jgi:transposase InsO family protein
VLTDNGPEWISGAFAAAVAVKAIDHHRIPPRAPNHHAMCERFQGTALQAAAWARLRPRPVGRLTRAIPRTVMTSPPGRHPTPGSRPTSPTTGMWRGSTPTTTDPLRVTARASVTWSGHRPAGQQGQRRTGARLRVVGAMFAPPS